MRSRGPALAGLQGRVQLDSSTGDVGLLRVTSADSHPYSCNFHTNVDLLSTVYLNVAGMTLKQSNILPVCYYEPCQKGEHLSS